MNEYPQFSNSDTQEWGYQRPRRWWLNLLLFLATVVTTMMTGASLQGYTWEAQILDFSLILHGWPYSFAVLLILTCHEFGHYFAAIYHRMNVTLPYYIPLPIPALFHFGTMGAFIKIKSPIPNRTALMDMAVAGPIASFVLSLLFLTIGYIQLPDTGQILAEVDAIHRRMGLQPEMLSEGAPTLRLGKSALIYLFNDLLGGGRMPMSEMYHFPFIFAGWVGLLVTALNLLPIGQLDGGHVLYAMFATRAKNYSRLAFAGLGGLTVSLYFFQGSAAFVWVPWMIILSIIGLRHPPTMNDLQELRPFRRTLGWLCVLIFFLSFMPLPFDI